MQLSTPIILWERILHVSTSAVRRHLVRGWKSSIQSQNTHTHAHTHLTWMTDKINIILEGRCKE